MYGDWHHNKPNDQVWWRDDLDHVGFFLFSFDQKKVYNLFEDYPHNLTEEERKIFDRENPHWKSFFTDRATA